MEPIQSDDNHMYIYHDQIPTPFYGPWEHVSRACLAQFPNCYFVHRSSHKYYSLLHPLAGEEKGRILYFNTIPKKDLPLGVIVDAHMQAEPEAELKADANNDSKDGMALRSGKILNPLDGLGPDPLDFPKDEKMDNDIFQVDGVNRDTSKSGNKGLHPSREMQMALNLGKFVLPPLSAPPPIMETPDLSASQLLSALTKNKFTPNADIPESKQPNFDTKLVEISPGVWDLPKQCIFYEPEVVSPLQKRVQRLNPETLKTMDKVVERTAQLHRPLLQPRSSFFRSGFCQALTVAAVLIVVYLAYSITWKLTYSSA